VDKLPQLVLVSVSTHEGVDGHYVSYLIPAKAVEHAAEVAKTIPSAATLTMSAH
jgi:hypothetical protein